MTSFPLALNQIRTGHLLYPKKGGKFGPHVRGAKGHGGWDLDALPGKSVFSVGPGSIIFVSDRNVPGYGRCLQLKFLHGSRPFWALYAHLSHVWVKKGQNAQQGVVIASTGTSGNAGGEPPHLHFEITTDEKLSPASRTNRIDPGVLLGRFLNDYPGGAAVVRESSYEIDLDRYVKQAGVS